MGVVQARIVSVQIIVFFLLATASLAAINIPDIPNANGACCVPLSGDIEFYENIQIAQQQCEISDSVYIESCFVVDANGDGYGELVDSSIADTGCCCVSTPGGPDALDTIEAGYDISELYCTELADGSYIPEQNNCPSLCQEDETYYTVQGNIESDDGDPLPGLTIRQSASNLEATSDANGDFEFNTLIVEGNHEFSVEVPFNYNLACDQDYSVIKTVESNTNTYYFTIELVCEDREIIIPTCESIWKVQVGDEWVDIEIAENGGWSACLVQGYQTRTIQDAANCENPVFIPESYRLCDDGEIDPTCGNDILDDGEQCDGTIFRTDNGQVNTNTFACSNIRDGYEGEVTCTDNCAYDTSECATPCDCLTLDQCSNECQLECQDEEICQDCPNPLTFIPEEENYNGALFELYDSALTDGDFYPEYPLEYTLGTKDVTLNWFASMRETCAIDVLGYEVIACKELDGQSGTCDPEATYVKSIDGVGSGELKTHTFENILEPQTRFCYNIVAIKQSGRDSLYELNNYPCFETGFEMCMLPDAGGLDCIIRDDESGQGLGPTTCERYSTIDEHVNHQIDTTFCQEGYTCVETEYEEGNYETGATCEPQQLCNSCNGMFGLFADYGLSVDFASSNIPGTFSCEEIIFAAAVDEELPGYGDGVKGQCFKEETKTLFSTYESCESVRSCYDYKSKGTCGVDPCFKFTSVSSTNGIIDEVLTTGCEWIDFNSTTENNTFFGAEVGVGVCRPVLEDQQDCSKCDTDSPIGFCNQDMCNVYGDCFQKHEIEDYQENALSATNNGIELPACLNAGDLACILYDNINDCLGEEPSTPYVDVLYEEYIGEDVGPEDRIAGNNKQTSSSNDRLGFGDCEWDYNIGFCYKNSDNYVKLPEIDDCLQSNPSSITCYRDVTPPNTTIFLKNETTDDGIPIYGMGEIADIPFGIEDDFSLFEDITTYVSVLREFCIDEGYVPCLDESQDNCLRSTSDISEINTAYASECYIYPQKTAQELVADFSQTNILNSDGGKHLFVFFSEDEAKNLEPLQVEQIYIDTQAPEVIITLVNVTTRNINEDEYFSDVDIYATVSEQSFCQAKLIDNTLSVFHGEEITVPFNTDFEAVPESDGLYHFQSDYTHLVDGTYELEIRCVDDLSNEGFANQTITINGDAGIKVISPLGGVYKNASDVHLEISTPYPATCKFDKSDNEFTSPTAKLFTQTGELDEEGRYIHTANYGNYYSNDSSGLYAVAISCQFENGEITEKKQGDILYFTIDNEPPSGTVYDLNDYYDADLAEWAVSRSFEIKCDDTSELTPLYVFGCEEIHYCVTKVKNLTNFNNYPDECGTSYTTKFQEDENANILIAQLPLTLGDEYTYLHYFLVDRAGAKSSTYSLNTKIRDPTTYEPFIDIY